MKTGSYGKYLRGLVVLICVGWQTANAQNHTLQIRVADSALQTIENASITVNRQQSVLDSGGQKSISLPSGRYKITISAVGYTNVQYHLTLSKDTLIDVILQRQAGMLDNVVVTANRNVYRNQMGIQSISIDVIKKLPVILGEIDPLKTLTLLPGIKSGGEASAGIYVRGGGPDQNLILLDDIPVYNPNHLLGFFSVFNGDAVKSMEVIKGAMPANYGGRLSSVIAIDTKEGSKDSIKGSGGIGWISSRLSLEAPIVKGRSSIIVSARRTYIDQAAKLVAGDTLKGNGYYFYDLNAKLDYLLNAKNKLVFTFYHGKDNFIFTDDDQDGPRREFNAIWGNTLAGLTWEQEINPNIRQKFSAIYNDFNLDSRLTFGSNGVIFSSGLTDWQFKDDWTINFSPSFRLKAGGQYIWHSFRPGAGSSSSGIQEFKSQVFNQYAREAAAYASAELNVTSRFNLVAGIRYSYFNQVGPNERFIYNADGSPTGESITYAKGESMARYHYPEPRISMMYKLPAQASLKLSYTQTVQYLHLATTSAATFPSDLWVPSGQLIKPGIAKQLALGFYKDLDNGRYEINVETYYKTMSNQIEFRPGAQLLLNQNLEGEMIFGSGKAYGIELFFQKKIGRLTGWIGYTLSRAERTYPEMNEGKPFPYRYDRTHDISVVANYRLGKKWETSAVFVYGTGNALTLPTGRFIYNVGYNITNREPIYNSISQYDKINDYRMPAYHRIDISFTFTPRPNSTKRFKSSWNFSLYNVYNRQNPYFIYFDVNDDTQTVKGKKVYLFPILPGLSWNFKF